MALTKQARQYLIKKAASLTYAIRMRKTAAGADSVISKVKRYLERNPELAGTLLGAGTGAVGGAGISSLLGGGAGTGALLGGAGGGLAGYAAGSERAAGNSAEAVADLLARKMDVGRRTLDKNTKRDIAGGLGAAVGGGLGLAPALLDGARSGGSTIRFNNRGKGLIALLAGLGAGGGMLAGRSLVEE